LRFHVRPDAAKEKPRNLYIDPRMRNNKDGSHRDFKLSDDEVQALVLFLKALNGDEVDEYVRSTNNKR